MIYHSLEEALGDLEKNHMLVRISQEVDPYLEMPEIARQAYADKAPALLFEHVKNSPFRAACNIFGTRERARFLFRDTLKAAETAIRAKADPTAILRHPFQWLQMPLIGLHALPVATQSVPVLFEECSLADLPQVQCAPQDGGAFLTLPQVFTEDPASSSIFKSNLGMYRIQISGNEYIQNKECGLHYQINRGIAAHHQKAKEQGKPLRVSIFLGGPPAHTFAAIMPMPENFSELIFAGILAGRAFRYQRYQGWCLSADADFCILGELAPDLKPEGPFGDHLGYYSAKHLFPYLKVKHVFHKKNAIYPFTVVGRPPQEDTTFGELIHEFTRPMVPVSIPGLYEMNAVDAAGVHPLMLALGSERYLPYESDREPMELLKIANALLGFNQAALSKFLFIAAKEDAPDLSVNSIQLFFRHMLERLDFSRDIHFQTATTMDTLDYSGTSLHHGSKVLFAAAGKPKRTLGENLSDLAESLSLPPLFSNPLVVMPGVVVIQATPEASMNTLTDALSHWKHRELFPWITIADDSSFTAKNLENWLWVTFTRTDPARDIYGAEEHILQKHWKCEAPLCVDARLKPYHQKPLEENPEIAAKAEAVLRSPVHS
jgi:4-hydroxy-3-polyprenylbenzoate decarboxylase